MNRISAIIVSMCFLVLCGCQTSQKSEPISLATPVDIQSFMGKWYVIAATPTLFDRQAYNAVETYTLEGNGINISYQFNKDGFDGDLKVYNSIGRIDNPGYNSDWNVSFVWPFKADYKVIYLKPDYSISIIGQQSRKYAWILSRTPTIDAPDYSDLMLFLQGEGYNIGEIRKIPQRWM